MVTRCFSVLYFVPRPLLPAFPLLHSAFVPSVEATSQELLQWLLDYASTSDKKDIKAAATQAATIGTAFRLTGGTLRSLPVASLIKFGAGGDTELADAWELIQLRWKAAVDGNASRPLLCNPALIVPLSCPAPSPTNSPAAPSLLHRLSQQQPTIHGPPLRTPPGTPPLSSRLQASH